MAWDDIMSEDFDEDEEPYTYDDILMKKPRRKKTMSEAMINPVDGGLGTAAALGGMFYFFWCLYHFKKSGSWSWTPWKPTVAPVARIAARVVPNNGYDPNRQIITLITP